MFFLFGSASDLNPDQLLSDDIKRAVGQARARDRDAMKVATSKWQHRPQAQRAIFGNFDEPHLRYAAA